MKKEERRLPRWCDIPRYLSRVSAEAVIIGVSLWTTLEIFCGGVVVGVRWFWVQERWGLKNRDGWYSDGLTLDSELW